ncbi:MAG TPA: EAL domain-containing protein [Thermomonas sp.]|nr:EAL domain-containing protein [Thermomonas sp.]
MGFRFRLASFFVAALVVVQCLTAVLVYRVARHELVQEGQRQLQVASGAFVRQLGDVSARVADSVNLLALDYALRSAFAQRDEATLLSALRNHGRRVGASQMLAVDVEGAVQADTRGEYRIGAAFPYADLTDRALEQPASAVVALDGGAYWMVVVPVFAPNLAGYIAAVIPVDDRLLSQLQGQSTLPKRVELASLGKTGAWTVLAHGNAPAGMAEALLAPRAPLPTTPSTLDVRGREYVVQGVWLDRSERSAPVAALLGYSVDDALSPYRSVAMAWGALSLLGLLAGLVGAWLIARGVARPVEQLAASARRIAAGDYAWADDAAPPAAPARDELGQLASAFWTMAQSIREREARILHQAGHDQVTGLSNRVAAEASIDQAIAAQPDAPAALLMVGLGHLPEIIKTLGHEVCDRVMRQASERLREPVRGGAIARATDGQFSVFLQETNRQSAIATAFRIVEALSDPYREADLTLDLAPAVGIALAPAHGARAGTLLRRAEVALIATLGADEAVAVYDPATDPHRPERLSLMADLREAIARDEGIALHFQPKLNLRSGAVDCAEALVRWRHPVLGMVPPATFVPLAEESGNVRRLTRWVLAAGIAQAARWQDAGVPMRLSLNISARDLDDAELPRRVAELLAVHRIRPGGIVLEVTESAIMGKPDAAIAVLRRLAEQGVDLSIDDFGVGQSSFAYLRRLPVRELKVDRTFVTRLGSAREDQLIVRSIVELGHHLGYRVTAEGVDDPAALAFLAEVGCDHAQGYLVAKPMDADAFEGFLAAGDWPGRDPRDARGGQP